MLQTKVDIMDDGAIKRALTRIAFEIIEKNHGDEILLVGIQTRGEFLAHRLAKKIGNAQGITPEVVALNISSLRDDIPPEKRHLPNFNKTPNVDNKIVIIVDDVLYTGRTARAAIEVISHIGRAAKIQLAVLIDRGHRELPIRPDYVGKNLPTALSERVSVRLIEVDNIENVCIGKL